MVSADAAVADGSDPAPCVSFFNDSDHGKSIVAEIPNQSDITLIGLSASYGLPLKVVMKLELCLKIKGQLPISGTVVKLANEAELITAIRLTMRQLNAVLFDAD